MIRHYLLRLFKGKNNDCLFIILNRLNDLEIDDNTLVIFTYDHGGRHLVDSGELFHGFATLWEGGVRVPLLIRWPNKMKGGEVFTTPTIAMDLTMTMLDAADRGDKVKVVDGVSLIGIMKDETKYKSRSLFWRFGKMKAVLQGNWKYAIDGHSQLLFNLSNDIGERENVFSQNKEKVNMFKRQLLDWEKVIDTEYF